ncbi:MAG TPA: hypothetical protein DC053_11420 [Lachnoclostridium sp.]|nr:hypothetical protein [Lachnoclostridium sp.]
MMDWEHLEFNMRDFRKQKGKPFCLANEEVADEMFPYVLAEFPEAVMVKQGICQYITVTKRARNELIKRFQISILNHEKEIAEINHAMQTLKAETPGAATPRESR